MTEKRDDPTQTTTPDQDAAPASQPAGAAEHGSPTEDQDAGPASEPTEAPDTDS